MSESKKYINIHTDVLIEWVYNNGNVPENYKVWTDLRNNERNYVSDTFNNKLSYSLFNVDPVLKKYSHIDNNKFNFLKIQDYFTSPIQYDKINFHFPFNYDFDDYIGFFVRIYCYDFENRKKYYFSNYYYDKSDINIEKLMQLSTPFRYGEREWGKYLTISIPSIHEVSNQRIVTSSRNVVVEDSINDNISNHTQGIGLNTPIFIEFSFIISKETVLGTTYFYLGDTFNTSISKSPDYQSLGVVIEESSDWDFFEIYGVYNSSNENIDNFIRDLESRGRRINIEYIVTLYEENIQSGFPIKFVVTENFSQKIEYRPVFKYSNTTAAIDVEMHIKDLVDSSSIIRRTSLGLTKNLFKYGKKLSRLSIENLYVPKIYNYRTEAVISNPNVAATNTYGITKVPYPLLINNYKILLNSSNSTLEADEYKSMGALTILLTPFDNVIKFKIARQELVDSTPEPYNLADTLSNARLTMIFKSDSQMVEKDIFYESDENDISMGIVVYKIKESDMGVIKNMYESDFDNFYLTIIGNETRTLLYSGKFKIFEDVKFIDDSIKGATIPIPEKREDLSASFLKSRKSFRNISYLMDDKVESTNQFKEENLPTRPPYDQSEFVYYRNLIVYMKQGLSDKAKTALKIRINDYGIKVFYEYTDTIILERVHVSKIKNIEDIPNVDNVYQLKLNLGWGETPPPTTPPVVITPGA